MNQVLQFMQHGVKTQHGFFLPDSQTALLHVQSGKKKKKEKQLLTREKVNSICHMWLSFLPHSSASSQLALI